MKPGLAVGMESSVETVVTEDMQAGFFGEVVHNAYGTMHMIAHMELAGRQIILPYLEDGEEAVGYTVNITHLSPTPVGMKVKATARVIAIEGREVTFAVEAYNELGYKIGEGTHSCMFLRKDRLVGRLAQLRAEWEARQAAASEAGAK